MVLTRVPTPGTGPGLPCVRTQPLSYVQLFATPWTIAHQAPLSVELDQQEYWSGLPFPPPGRAP